MPLSSKFEQNGVLSLQQCLQISKWPKVLTMTNFSDVWSGSVVDVPTKPKAFTIVIMCGRRRQNDKSRQENEPCHEKT